VLWTRADVVESLAPVIRAFPGGLCKSLDDGNRLAKAACEPTQYVCELAQDACEVAQAVCEVAQALCKRFDDVKPLAQDV
jgi:hypothetical protein